MKPEECDEVDRSAEPARVAANYSIARGRPDADRSEGSGVAPHARLEPERVAETTDGQLDESEYGVAPKSNTILTRIILAGADGKAEIDCGEEGDGREIPTGTAPEFV